MKILYASNGLEKSVSTDRALKKAYGTSAKRMKLRLSLLNGASTLADVSHKKPPRRHKLHGEYAGCFAVDVTGNLRIIFYPVMEHEADEEPELEAITTIRIVAIEDYH
ncbi:MAG: plasmid maintenance system killer protein [Pseudomonadota bacterium]